MQRKLCFIRGKLVIGDVSARLALVPLAAEARGLDAGEDQPTSLVCNQRDVEASLCTGSSIAHDAQELSSLNCFQHPVRNLHATVIVFWQRCMHYRLRVPGPNVHLNSVAQLLSDTLLVSALLSR